MSCLTWKALKNTANYRRKDLDQLQAGARIEINEIKKNPMDFVLWKMSKENEPSWPSPWGAGRPGWHIECSAMNCKQLGEHFDIHGGGSDLMFPHHGNKIAQSCCAHGGQYVNYWIHSGMIMVDKEKMSRSLGNFFTIRDVLNHYNAEAVRYFLLTAHYRSQLNYSEENLNLAQGALERLYARLYVAPIKVRSLLAVKILWKPSVRQWTMISIRRMPFLSYLKWRVQSIN